MVFSETAKRIGDQCADRVLHELSPERWPQLRARLAPAFEPEQTLESQLAWHVLESLRARLDEALSPEAIRERALQTLRSIRENPETMN